MPLLPLASMTYPHVLIAGFLNAFHLKIHTNGYQNLTENLDDVPDKFREVISPLNEIYTYNKYEIDKFDDRMDKITDRLMDELSTSKPWIHKFGENQPDDSLINYFLNDPFYKNALFIYKSGATNLCLEVEIFNLNATEAYKTIAKLTDILKNYLILSAII